MSCFDNFTYYARYIIDYNYNDMPDIEAEIIGGSHDKEMAIIEAKSLYNKYRYKNISIWVTDIETNEIIWNSDSYKEEVEYELY